eukprot:TRINITY_DN178_c0_g1_i10.p2 TRINITY_DN178_c0_g1~~TRINITY_DN178_c0_g1_i10.p2  ORF type:complete len:106 (+),score=0.70 TRINITY_DN178_c0_g1_i10:576-893(+)
MCKFILYSGICHQTMNYRFCPIHGVCYMKCQFIGRLEETKQDKIIIDVSTLSINNWPSKFISRYINKCAASNVIRSYTTSERSQLFSLPKIEQTVIAQFSTLYNP